MKAIMISIRPEWVAKILNGEKTIEIRKRFPKDYVGWVYIYCTKPTKHTQLLDRDRLSGKWKLWFGTYTPKNGKVVTRFWCDKVEEIICRPICGEWECYTKTLGYSEIAKASCLENREIVHYLKGKNGTAIHINDLEIFDKPKEISEFKVKGFEKIKVMGSPYGDLDSVAYHYEKKPKLKPLTRAPQSWCYVEVI